MKASQRKLKLTGWYGNWQKPLKSRPGRYLVKYGPDQEKFKFWWSGFEWKTAPLGHVMWEQNLPWRGVAR